MKTTLKALMALWLMLPLGASAQGIVFEDNKPLADVLARAKQEKKLVFVDCYTTWCGPCKVLAREVFPQQKAGDFFNTRFVSLKLDMEKGEGPEMQNRWDVNGYPTLVFLDPDGEVLFQTIGARSAEHLIDTVAYLLEHHEPTEVARRYKQGERNSRLVIDYIAELLKENKSRRAAEVAGDYVASHKDDILTDTLVSQMLERLVADTHNEGLLFAYDHRQQLSERLQESLEMKWRMYTKNYYIMDGQGGLSIDEPGMQAYYEFMQQHGVAQALLYYMSYKLPASFIMKDKRMMLECLDKSIGLEGIASGQITMAVEELERQELTEAERHQLDELKKRIP